MYRIRVFNKDGTLGGFFSENGIVKDPALAKTYSKDFEYKEDISRAFKMSGGVYYPSITYGITSLALASDQASIVNSFKTTTNTTPKSYSNDLNQIKSFLPPFEDKPSRSGPDEGIDSVPLSYFDYNGGDLDQEQEIDIDGGVA